MDLLKRMSIEFGRNLSIVSKYTNTGITDIFNQLKIALVKFDEASIKFCVDEICKWYQKNLSEMGIYARSFQEQNENFQRFSLYQEQLKTYEFSQVLNTSENVNSTSTKTMVFISHSSKDEKTVRQLETFLSGLGITQELIFCSSIEGQGVKNGERIEEKVRNSIKNSKLLLYVISQNFMESTYCVQELGAGWILRDYGISTFLIKLDDIEYKDIRGFINSDFKCCELNDDNLDELIDNIRELYSIPHTSSTRNKKLKKSFLDAIQNDIKKLKNQAKLSKEEQVALDKKSKEDTLLACTDAERKIILSIYQSETTEVSLNCKNAAVQLLEKKGIIFNGESYYDLLDPMLSYMLSPWVYETLKANEKLLK